jgi:hypothetical protein
MEGLDLAGLAIAKENEDKYPFVVSWFHTSSNRWHNGNKAKMQFFEEQSKAQKVYDRLLAIKQSDGTYQQGFITYLTKNF